MQTKAKAAGGGIEKWWEFFLDFNCYVNWRISSVAPTVQGKFANYDQFLDTHGATWTLLNYLNLACAPYVAGLVNIKLIDQGVSTFKCDSVKKKASIYSWTAQKNEGASVKQNAMLGQFVQISKACLFPFIVFFYISAGPKHKKKTLEGIKQTCLMNWIPGPAGSNPAVAPCAYGLNSPLTDYLIDTFSNADQPTKCYNEFSTLAVRTFKDQEYMTGLPVMLPGDAADVDGKVALTDAVGTDIFKALVDGYKSSRAAAQADEVEGGVATAVSELFELLGPKSLPADRRKNAIRAKKIFEYGDEGFIDQIDWTMRAVHIGGTENLKKRDWCTIRKHMETRSYKRFNVGKTNDKHIEVVKIAADKDGLKHQGWIQQHGKNIYILQYAVSEKKATNPKAESIGPCFYTAASGAQEGKWGALNDTFELGDTSTTAIMKILNLAVQQCTPSPAGCPATAAALAAAKAEAGQLVPWLRGVFEYNAMHSAKAFLEAGETVDPHTNLIALQQAASAAAATVRAAQQAASAAAATVRAAQTEKEMSVALVDAAPVAAALIIFIQGEGDIKKGLPFFKAMLDNYIRWGPAMRAAVSTQFRLPSAEGIAAGGIIYKKLLQLLLNAKRTQECLLIECANDISLWAVKTLDRAGGWIGILKAVAKGGTGATSIGSGLSGAHMLLVLQVPKRLVYAALTKIRDDDVRRFTEAAGKYYYIPFGFGYGIDSPPYLQEGPAPAAPSAAAAAAAAAADVVVDMDKDGGGGNKKIILKGGADCKGLPTEDDEECCVYQCGERALDEYEILYMCWKAGAAGLVPAEADQQLVEWTHDITTLFQSLSYQQKESPISAVANYLAGRSGEKEPFLTSILQSIAEFFKDMDPLDHDEQFKTLANAAGGGAVAVMGQNTAGKINFILQACTWSFAVAGGPEKIKMWRISELSHQFNSNFYKAAFRVGLGRYNPMVVQTIMAIKPVTPDDTFAIINTIFQHVHPGDTSLALLRKLGSAMWDVDPDCKLCRGILALSKGVCPDNRCRQVCRTCKKRGFDTVKKILFDIGMEARGNDLYACWLLAARGGEYASYAKQLKPELAIDDNFFRLAERSKGDFSYAWYLMGQNNVTTPAVVKLAPAEDYEPYYNAGLAGQPFTCPDSALTSMKKFAKKNAKTNKHCNYCYGLLTFHGGVCNDDRCRNACQECAIAENAAADEVCVAYEQTGWNALAEAVGIPAQQGVSPGAQLQKGYNAEIKTMVEAVAAEAGTQWRASNVDLKEHVVAEVNTMVAGVGPGTAVPVPPGAIAAGNAQAGLKKWAEELLPTIKQWATQQLRQEERAAEAAVEAGGGRKNMFGGAWIGAAPAAAKAVLAAVSLSAKQAVLLALAIGIPLDQVQAYYRNKRSMLYRAAAGVSRRIGAAVPESVEGQVMVKLKDKAGEGGQIGRRGMMYTPETYDKLWDGQIKKNYDPDLSVEKMSKLRYVEPIGRYKVKNLQDLQAALKNTMNHVFACNFNQMYLVYQENVGVKEKQLGIKTGLYICADGHYLSQMTVPYSTLSAAAAGQHGDKPMNCASFAEAILQAALGDANVTCEAPLGFATPDSCLINRAIQEPCNPPPGMLSGGSVIFESGMNLTMSAPSPSPAPLEAIIDASSLPRITPCMRAKGKSAAPTRGQGGGRKKRKRRRRTRQKRRKHKQTRRRKRRRIKRTRKHRKRRKYTRR